MMKVKDTRGVYLPEYYCYSEYDKNYFLRKKIAIKKINISGSFRNSLALEYIKKKKIKINKKKFDICVIGEADKIWQKENSIQTYFPDTPTSGTDTLVFKEGSGEITFKNDSPPGAEVGMLRYNSTLGQMEHFNSGGWKDFTNNRHPL